MIIGITGGIGSGKSAVADILAGYGARVVLADEIAKNVVEPGMPAYQDIVQIFGSGILDGCGLINRKKLGDIVFKDKNKLKQLEEVTHRAVTKRIKKELETLKRQGYELLVVEAVVPVEQGFLDLVDTVWVVAADESVRVQRIMQRNHFSEEEAKQRILAQMSDAAYIKLGHQVIYNNGTIEALKKEVWKRLKHEKKKNIS